EAGRGWAWGLLNRVRRLPSPSSAIPLYPPHARPHLLSPHGADRPWHDRAGAGLAAGHGRPVPRAVRPSGGVRPMSFDAIAVGRRVLGVEADALRQMAE